MEFLEGEGKCGMRGTILKSLNNFYERIQNPCDEGKPATITAGKSQFIDSHLKSC
jgi:hypothetical protein